MIINARNLHFKELNARIKASEDSEITVKGALGQRYIGSGVLGRRTITIQGVPGNALGAYLDSSNIVVCGNAQDATGDTMNDGTIVIHGSAGDATGYAMRGGKIYVHGNTGYRAGIHMKEYKDKVPVIVIGASTGSFLGEDQAGGIIIVLGLGSEGKLPVGNFCSTGMHGGKVFLRTDEAPKDLPRQVVVKKATRADLAQIQPYLEEFCTLFDENVEKILEKPFIILTPDTKNPYKQLYTQN